MEWTAGRAGYFLWWSVRFLGVSGDSFVVNAFLRRGMEECERYGAADHKLKSMQVRTRLPHYKGVTKSSKDNLFPLFCTNLWNCGSLFFLFCSSFTIVMHVCILHDHIFACLFWNEGVPLRCVWICWWCEMVWKLVVPPSFFLSNSPGPSGSGIRMFSGMHAMRVPDDFVKFWLLVLTVMSVFGTFQWQFPSQSPLEGLWQLRVCMCVCVCEAAWQQEQTLRLNGKVVIFRRLGCIKFTPVAAGKCDLELCLFFPLNASYSSQHNITSFHLACRFWRILETRQKSTGSSQKTVCKVGGF